MAQAAQQHSARASSAVKHKRAHKSAVKRDSARARGYDAGWEAFRLQFLSAYPICEYCLARGRVVPATVVDHDLPHQGDADLFWDNTFTALCKWDHDSTKARLEARLSGDALLAAVKKMKTARKIAGRGGSDF